VALWKRLWLLFTVIWVVLAVLQTGTILAVGEEPAEKALRPALLGVAVPALLYLILWAWARLRRKKGPDPS
jgi:hypothetical protein